jgi:hypothetical protein
MSSSEDDVPLARATKKPPALHEKGTILPTTMPKLLSTFAGNANV